MKIVEDMYRNCKDIPLNLNYFPEGVLGDYIKMVTLRAILISTDPTIILSCFLHQLGRPEGGSWHRDSDDIWYHKFPEMGKKIADRIDNEDDLRYWIKSMLSTSDTNGLERVRDCCKHFKLWWEYKNIHKDHRRLSGNAIRFNRNNDNILNKMLFICDTYSAITQDYRSNGKLFINKPTILKNIRIDREDRVLVSKVFQSINQAQNQTQSFYISYYNLDKKYSIDKSLNFFRDIPNMMVGRWSEIGRIISNSEVKLDSLITDNRKKVKERSNKIIPIGETKEVKWKISIDSLNESILAYVDKIRTLKRGPLRRSIRDYLVCNPKYYLLSNWTIENQVQKEYYDISTREFIKLNGKDFLKIKKMDISNQTKQSKLNL